MSMYAYKLGRRIEAVATGRFCSTGSCGALGFYAGERIPLAALLVLAVLLRPGNAVGDYAPGLASVRALLELAEQEHHGGLVHELDHGHWLWDNGVEENDRRHMAQACEELHHLYVGHHHLVRVTYAEGCDEVVRVHHRMHEGVAKSSEARRASGAPDLQEEAPDDGDGGVVVQVQKGELGIFLAHNDEERVQVVGVLEQIVHEHGALDSDLALEVEAEKVGREVEANQFVHDVDIGNHLQDVVQPHDGLTLQGLAVSESTEQAGSHQEIDGRGRGVERGRARKRSPAVLPEIWLVICAGTNAVQAPRRCVQDAIPPHAFH
mmetsp:Transcript_12652/g.46241  ORF Transcript_12652/g.46241 Transcript_12652/m.46241 type:complete len:321 (+) Transcript_12652:1754-2716(+)|eukprot:scaffold233_cov548-Prasinococcus_capsulatus_cf.AAC.2